MQMADSQGASATLNTRLPTYKQLSTRYRVSRISRSSMVSGVRVSVMVMIGFNFSCRVGVRISDVE